MASVNLHDLDAADSPPNSRVKEPDVWLHYGDPDDEAFEDCIIGSRKGLLQLRDRIDEALREGDAWFEHPDIQFDGVKLDDSPDPEPPRERCCYECIWAWGALLLIAVILVLAVVGAWSLFV